jgi:hypothetical protein
LFTGRKGKNFPDFLSLNKRIFRKARLSKNQFTMNTHYLDLTRNKSNYAVLNVLLILFFISGSQPLKSQEDSLTIDTISNYHEWGWESLVIRNKYITVAVVPSMGGNILQYDFGIDTFLVLEPATYGQDYSAGTGNSPFDGSWGFGGFQIWPTPEAWPPPPNLTYRIYSYSLDTINSDSLVLSLVSEPETEIFPSLQMKRKITIYRRSTRVKVENTLINLYSRDCLNGMMNATYVRPEHENRNDFENFVMSFPINPESSYSNGVYFNTQSTSFLGQLVPGVYGIEYRNTQGKIFADVRDGWMGYVDKQGGQSYCRVFDVMEQESYPDNGARLEVYVSINPQFMAIEVMSPLYDIAKNGGSCSFTENLYASENNELIVKAGHAGLVSQRIGYDSIQGMVAGKFSVFSEGTARLEFLNYEHNLLDTAGSFSVYPDKSYELKDTIELPVQTR